ncbi:MAG: type I-E CRISPR-associated protein Cse1/CasA [Nitrospirota bacterium]
MNLLIEEWIPVRPLPTGAMKKVSLKQLLCGNEAWELCLPRDDMELAAVQLLICMTQVLLTPKSIDELKRRIAKPLTETDYDAAIKPFHDWFQLDHPTQPFMQVRGLAAKDVTPLDKLMAGLTGATNCCFVNEPDLATGLCPGCSAIVLFNQATCTPGFGGGFKDPLRGGTPITTLIQGPHLRQMVWLNVLCESEVARLIPWDNATKQQKPTWIDPIKDGDIPAQSIGLKRGLFWQPAYVELLSPVKAGSACSSCGLDTEYIFTGFKKAKFSSYKVDGTWPHPHSAKVLERKRNGSIEQWFTSFTSSAPAWTQLNRFVEQLEPQGPVKGHEFAAVVHQVKNLYGQQAQKLHLAIGGYRRSKASIVDRCHEVFTLNQGWSQHSDVIRGIVSLGLGYKAALTGALYLFSNGMKDQKTNAVVAKGLGEKMQLQKMGEVQFYRATESVMQNILSCIDFEEPAPAFDEMRRDMESICKDIFGESVRPYLSDPELVRTMAIARRTLGKKLSALKPQQGGTNATTKAP